MITMHEIDFNKSVNREALLNHRYRMRSNDLTVACNDY